MVSDKSLWEILVPCNYNDGKPVRTKHHKQWDKVVRGISGGLTLYQPVRGQWVDPETNDLIADRVIPVRIKCNEKEIRMIAKFTIQHYRQKAVLTYRISDHVIMTYAESNKRGTSDDEEDPQPIKSSR